MTKCVSQKKVPALKELFIGPGVFGLNMQLGTNGIKLVKSNSSLGKGEALPGTAKSPEEAISRRLKALYNAVEQEEVPDRFLDLLERLDAAESASTRKAKG